MIEEVDALVDASTGDVEATVRGTVDAHVHLTGMPDLSVVFNDPKVYMISV